MTVSDEQGNKCGELEAGISQPLAKRVYPDIPTRLMTCS